MWNYARKIGEKAGEPEWLIQLREEAEEFIDKAPFPEEIQPVDLEEYNPLGKGDIELPDIKDPANIPPEIKNMLTKMGIPEREWPLVLGMIQVDTASSTSSLKGYFEKLGVTILPLRDALKVDEEAKEYAFKLMPYKENKIVAYHTAYWNGGVYLKVGKNVTVPQALHTYFLITESKLAQADHALFILEEGSSATLIEGCTAPILSRFSAHLGATEVFVKKNAKAKVVVLQNWPNYVHTRPYTRVWVEEGGEIEVVVAILGTGKSSGRYEEIYLKGKNAKARVNSISFVREKGYLDDVIKIYMEAPDTTAYINTKGVVKDEGISNSYTMIKALHGACNSIGHIECTGLLLNSGAIHSTYPLIVSESKTAQLEHEAFVGKIEEEVIEYMRSRGLTEENALSLVLRGYIDPVAEMIPFEFSAEVRRMATILAERGGA